VTRVLVTSISQEIYDQHIAEERARHFKAQDKEQAANDPARIKVITMDLQLLLLCPKSYSSAIYYKRKLSVHNFTLYDLITEDGQCYLWHEVEGGLDSDEFATVVVDYLMSLPDSTECAVLCLMDVLIRIEIKHWPLPSSTL